MRGVKHEGRQRAAPLRFGHPGCGFLAGESLDGLQCLVGVAFHVAGVVDDVADDALGIDDVGDAADHAALFVPRAKRFGGFMIGIPTDEPVAQAAMLRKRGLGWNQINA